MSWLSAVEVNGSRAKDTDLTIQHIAELELA